MTTRSDDMDNISIKAVLSEFAKELAVEALEMTIKEYLDILKDTIEHDVYEAYEGDWALSGMRTYELLDAWIIEPPDVFTDIISQELHFDLNKITLWFTQYQGRDVTIHEDKYGRYDKDFPMLINDGIYNFGFAPKRPFWDNFVEYVEKNFEKDFQKNLNKVMR